MTKAETITAEEAARLTSLCEVWSIGNKGFAATTRCDSNPETGNAYGEGSTVLIAVLACHANKQRYEKHA